MEKLSNLAKLIRYFILLCSTEAGSGHPSSSLSATDLMTVLFFGGFFKFDLKNPENPNNDRLIFSKGHASPLFYSLYTAAGAVTEEELKTYRRFDSRLEGHPTPQFPFTEAATGSLGQGLSIGLGMALNGKNLDKLPYTTYVLLGDSEMAEGSMWEAIQLSAHYKLDNLIAVLDVNRLGQRGETMYGHDVSAYQKRVSSFGWETIVIGGHNLEEIVKAFESAHKVKDRPVMIIAKTLKGKGVSLLEDKDGWHGKALKKEEFEEAVKELGKVDKSLRGEVQKPRDVTLSGSEGTQDLKKTKPADSSQARNDNKVEYKMGELVATRKAYGNALEGLFPKYPEIVVLDAEVSNSTYADIFKKSYPEKFLEMYIAEQNMVGAALGLSKRGKIPFVSTFAAFFSRAFDQIRMSQYSEGNIKFVGSHAGVSIGEDGASQMGLEDIALFRSLLNSVVLYPSDAVSAEKLVEKAAEYIGDVYIRTTRMETPVLYESGQEFNIGGSKVLKSSKEDQVTVIGAGVTLHEALKAYEKLQKEKIKIRVIDLYSVKPLDIETLSIAASETKAIIVVEDHFEVGGMGEAVMNALSGMSIPIHSLAVRKMPRSGKPEELLEYEDISAKGIIAKVKDILKENNF
jgi:transketolase